MSLVELTRDNYPGDNRGVGRICVCVWGGGGGVLNEIVRKGSFCTDLFLGTLYIVNV